MSPPLRVGVAGLGTVGTAVLRLLSDHGETLVGRVGRAILVTGVSARDRGKPHGAEIAAAWHDDPVALARSTDVDCLVELIGGESGPALDATRAALAAGK